MAGVRRVDKLFRCEALACRFTTEYKFNFTRHLETCPILQSIQETEASGADSDVSHSGRDSGLFVSSELDEDAGDRTSEDEACASDDDDAHGFHDDGSDSDEGGRGAVGGIGSEGGDTDSGDDESSTSSDSETTSGSDYDISADESEEESDVYAYAAISSPGDWFPFPSKEVAMLYLWDMSGDAVPRRKIDALLQIIGSPSFDPKKLQNIRSAATLRSYKKYFPVCPTTTVSKEILRTRKKDGKEVRKKIGMEILSVKTYVEMMFSNPLRRKFIMTGLNPIDHRSTRVSEFNQTPFAQSTLRWSTLTSLRKDGEDIKVGSFYEWGDAWVVRICDFLYENGVYDKARAWMKKRDALSTDRLHWRKSLKAAIKDGRSTATIKSKLTAAELACDTWQQGRGDAIARQWPVAAARVVWYGRVGKTKELFRLRTGRGRARLEEDTGIVQLLDENLKPKAVTVSRDKHGDADYYCVAAATSAPALRTARSRGRNPLGRSVAAGLDYKLPTVVPLEQVNAHACHTTQHNLKKRT